MLAGNEVGVDQVLNKVDKQFERIRSNSGQYAHHQTQQQYQLLLTNMLLNPLDHLSVFSFQFSDCVSQPMPSYLLRSQSSSTSFR